MRNSIPFDNSYARLPTGFFTPQQPTPVTAPALIRLNSPLASQLGLDSTWLTSTEGVAMLAGNQVPEGAEPIATVYAGHQFGHFNPQLGDGRAVLLGELLDTSGQRFDLQLKGSGPTPYSRGGDGRAPLGPVLREYLVSEAMAVLGIPTTRSLAAVASGEPVFRDSLLPGAVLTRVARSHIRIGTFQYFAARQDLAALKQLADHVIERHYPELAASAQPYLDLLQAYSQRLAALVAAWQQVGFIHGVLNTDNMLLSGETVDYGPCAFMDTYDPATVYSAIDEQGRYAYQNQPQIAQWNLMQLAQSLLPLIDANQEAAVARATEVLEGFAEHYYRHHWQGMSSKLGLSTPTDSDPELIRDLLTVMQESRLDYTLTLRQLSDPSLHAGLAEDLAPWKDRWLARAGTEVDARPDYASMQGLNPVCIPRNHLIEAVISAAIEEDDLAPFNQLVDVLQDPFNPQHYGTRFAKPPAPEERIRNTFCGT